jgi:glycosyltransferase involved in cell wall biosynthesis
MCSLEAVSREPFDAIISTYGPSATHLAAYVVAVRTGWPWIADYRDLWYRNPLSPRGRMHNAMAWQLERAIIRSAKAITCVEGLQNALAELHHREIDVIPNALDIDTWQPYRQLQPREFRICYAGRLYGGLRSPEMLFNALARMRERQEPAGLAARVVFYGPEMQDVDRCARKFGLQDIVTLGGWVDRAVALKAEKESVVLLILLSDNPVAAHYHGSKILEYLGADRFILALGPKGSAIADILEVTGAGQFATSEDECERALRDFYAAFQRGIFGPQTRGTWGWSPAALAEAFARVLDRIQKS